MKKLGILFIIIAVFLGIGAFVNSSPGDMERMQSEYADKARGRRKEMEALNKFAELSGVRAHKIDTSYEDEERSDSASKRSEREQRLLFYAIPAGLLGITGLVLVVSQRQPTRIPLPTAPRPSRSSAQPLSSWPTCAPKSPVPKPS